MIRFIFADLRRFWPGALTLLLIASLAAGLGFAVSLQERGLRLGSARAADRFDLVIGAAGSETQLVLTTVFLQHAALPLIKGSALADLMQDQRVAFAAPIALGDSFNRLPIVGTTTGLVSEVLNGVAQGRLFEKNFEAVVGSATGLPVGNNFRPMHGLADQGGHSHNEIAYSVTGILAPTGTAWDRAILVPVRSVWATHDLAEETPTANRASDADHHEEGHSTGDRHENHADHDHQRQDVLDENFGAGSPPLPAILVKPKSIGDAYKLRQEYRQGETLGVFPAEVLTSLYATLGDARQILAIMAIATQVLVAAAMILVTIVYIGQRSREIGTLRALGASRHTILTIIWGELFLLIASGIGIGLLIGIAAAKALSSAVRAETGMILPVELASQDFIVLGLLILFAAILSLLPALLAYRQSPVEALR
ncbi:ABC transporter permease [Paraburkholderia aspalathi]|nr:ABC transporter permease [Paraburkholderia aspalathi]